MFNLIFKTMIIVVFLVVLSVGLAMWKGGEPFRYFGEGVVVVGKSIMKFGDLVDEFIAGGKKIRKSYEELKDVINTDDNSEGTDETR